MDGRAVQSSDISRPAPHQGHKGSDDFQHSRAKGRERSYEGAASNVKDKRSRFSYTEPNNKEERDWRNDRGSRKHESESYHREDKYSRERDSRSGRDRDASRHHHRRERDE